MSPSPKDGGMSRNFELLQKLGKEQELLGSLPMESSSAAASAVAPAFAAPVTAPQPGLEEITGIVQQVFLMPAADAPRVVVFAGTEPGTGVTWVAARVAEALAGRVAASVCIVDANLRAPGMHQQMGAENQVGLADALVNPEPIRNFARQLTPSNLWMITAGSNAENQQGLLASDRMRLRIQELRSEFDFILVDTPSLAASNVAVGLGSLSDGVVLVLKANASRRESATQAVEDFHSGNAKVLGAVLNQRKFPIPNKIYNKL
jgi:Mrp family chromosome partitioning ATPase